MVGSRVGPTGATCPVYFVASETPKTLISNGTETWCQQRPGMVRLCPSRMQVSYCECPCRMHGASSGPDGKEKTWWQDRSGGGRLRRQNWAVECCLRLKGGQDEARGVDSARSWARGAIRIQMRWQNVRLDKTKSAGWALGRQVPIQKLLALANGAAHERERERESLGADTCPHPACARCQDLSTVNLPF